MRRIGTLKDLGQATRFSDYLVTLEVDCVVDHETIPATDGGPSRDECHLWVRDEGHVEKAKQELESFLASPDDDRYQVSGSAERIRKEKAAEEKRKQSLQQKVRHRSGSAMSPMMGMPVRQQSIPIVITVLVLSVVLSFATQFATRLERGSSQAKIYRALSFVDPLEYAETRNPWISVRSGEVWRLLSPVFMHGNMMHLAFNMMAMWFLGSAIERLQGSPFLAILFVFSGVVGCMAQAAGSQIPELARFCGSPFGIGASGAVYGLFGYLWIRPQLSPSFPIRLPQSTVMIMLGWLLLGIFFFSLRVANGGHVGGLVAGILVATALSNFRAEGSA